MCSLRGTAKTGGEKVYAIDPHTILPEEGHLESTEAEFRVNIRNAGVESQVEPVKPKTAVIRPAKSSAFDTDDTSH